MKKLFRKLGKIFTKTTVKNPNVGDRIMVDSKFDTIIEKIVNDKYYFSDKNGKGYYCTIHQIKILESYEDIQKRKEKELEKELDKNRPSEGYKVNNDLLISCLDFYVEYNGLCDRLKSMSNDIDKDIENILKKYELENKLETTPIDDIESEVGDMVHLSENEKIILREFLKYKRLENTHKEKLYNELKYHELIVKHLNLTEAIQLEDYEKAEKIKNEIESL